jgi:hypothetical protein
MVCPGNSNELCGAGNFLSVYNTDNLIVYQPPTAQKTNLPGSWGYVGCFTDNINNSRALFWQIILTNNNTATSCLGLWQQYGYMAAGMVGTDGKNHFPPLDSFMSPSPRSTETNATAVMPLSLPPLVQLRPRSLTAWASLFTFPLLSLT